MPLDAREQRPQLAEKEVKVRPADADSLRAHDRLTRTGPARLRYVRDCHRPLGARDGRTHAQALRVGRVDGVGLLDESRRPVEDLADEAQLPLGVVVRELATFRGTVHRPRGHTQRRHPDRSPCSTGPSIAMTAPLRLAHRRRTWNSRPGSPKSSSSRNPWVTDHAYSKSVPLASVVHGLESTRRPHLGVVREADSRATDFLVGVPRSRRRPRATRCHRALT